MTAILHRALLRFGLALVMVTLLLLAEGARVVAAAGAEVAGDWEAILLARGVPAIGVVAAAPLVAIVVAYSALLPMLEWKRGRYAWAVAMTMVVTPFALELTSGRKARALEVRVPFVAGTAALTFALVLLVGPKLVAALRRRPAYAPLLGVALVAAARVVDVRVLPRLYPVFHHALVALMVIGIVLVAHGLGVVLARRPTLVSVLALLGPIFLALAIVRTAKAGPELARFDNARRIAHERSDLFTRIVAIAHRAWPPRPLDLDGDVDPLSAPVARTLDASGRDVVLITIDALRADHVGAYGYPRPTTPAIDALAAEGVVFERAYTPTPHTSYAIASLMTGKYMRPVLALEAAAGSATRRPDETWAGLLRAYGFRTAAFFPPAVWAVDGDRFAPLRDRGLDFEYTKIEFADPSLRAHQVKQYLSHAPTDKPLFLWVHLFEPHEPYVAHAKHPFGDGEIDRYDSEIAAADAGVDAIVRSVRARRPGAVIIVSADHGEAFGEHGARYHGTTVYEEQVRVPLIVSAPGLVARRRVARPVQIVDLLPTVLSMYAVPRPPRVRGVDLGELLAPAEPKPGEGIAFSEVEDAAMLARGNERLICNRKVATCVVYDLQKDPAQLAPIGNHPREAELRRAMGGLLAASARLEGFVGSEAQSWPEPLRRAFAGDPDAAIEVAPLLDDVDVGFRRRAAEVLARLARVDTHVHVKRAIGKEQDEVARRWLAVALVRTNANVPSAESLVELAKVLSEGEPSRWAALAIAEAMQKGAATPGPVAQARAYEILVDWLPTARADGELGRKVIRALPLLLRGSLGALARRATPVLKDALFDIRLRAEAARALGLLGDPGAAAVLESVLAEERHLDARVPEVLALARVGDPDRARMHLARFLGMPEPPPGGAAALIDIASLALPVSWSSLAKAPAKVARFGLVVPKGTAHRLVIAGPKPNAVITVKFLAQQVEGVVTDAGGIVELGDKVVASIGDPIAFEVASSDGDVQAAAIVPRVDELPPPKPDATYEGGDAQP